MTEPTSSDVALLTATEQELLAALAALDDVAGEQELVVARAKAAVAAARATVVDKLSRYGAAAQLNDTVPDRDLMRKVYWEHPLVPAQAMSDVLGLPSASFVHAHVGPSAGEHLCKGGCGTVFTQTFTSRNQILHGWFWCADCQAAREAEWEARNAEPAGGRPTTPPDPDTQEYLDTMQAALDSGVRPARIYVEYPGVPGTWRVEGGTIGGAAISDRT